MENTISDRIGLLISMLGYNKRTFSRAIGLGNDVTIGRIVNEHREPSYKILNNIIQTFGNINANWLLTGEGEVFRKNVPQNVHPNVHLTEKSDSEKLSPNSSEEGEILDKKSISESISLSISSGKENGNLNGNLDGNLTEKTAPRIAPSKISSYAVPYYDIPVSAGPLGVLTYSRDAVKPDGYIDMEIFRRCEAILPVIGVSMEPEIHSGDLIGIRKLEYYSWEYIETGKVYMIITQEDRMIKYINKADDPDYIVCSSPNYHDFKIRKADVLEIYRVIANIRAL